MFVLFSGKSSVVKGGKMHTSEKKLCVNESTIHWIVLYKKEKVEG
jgi:hypothetical protein